MLLRHFEAFANLSSNEGSQSDQAGVAMEISSTIREYTKPLLEDDELHTNGTANEELVRSFSITKICLSHVTQHEIFHV
jgi:hypothetical protein